MKILHVVPGLNETWNGIAVAAKLIADGQRKEGHEVDLVDTKDFDQPVSAYAEIWVHSMWTWWLVWRACFKVIRCRAAIGVPRLVRMTHANLDPLRYRYHGWKKWLLTPIERWIFSKTDRVVVTCEAEVEWNRHAGVTASVEVIDLKKFFNLHSTPLSFDSSRPLHVLYLGRRHPLKGIRYLEQAVNELNHHSIELRVESNIFGEEKDAAWMWCDVLCLPTLSENFGLVVAEALERGKRVITTDGAPVWSDLEPAQGFYLRGYREGTDEERVKLLKDALIRTGGNI